MFEKLIIEKVKIKPKDNNKKNFWFLKFLLLKYLIWWLIALEIEIHIEQKIKIPENIAIFYI